MHKMKQMHLLNYKEEIYRSNKSLKMRPVCFHKNKLSTKSFGLGLLQK